MPDLRPFRGLRYATLRVPDLTAVLCPPYDVISPSARDVLLARDPVNAVRLELPSPTPATAVQADFANAATTLEGWLADGTLQRDAEPSLYIYEQRYTVDGQVRVARSFFCELRLEEYGHGGVRPHERTLAGPREHRFQLLSAVRTHLSPVLLLYDDGAGGTTSAALLDELTAAPADAEATGPDDVGQRLWRLAPGTSEPARALLALAAARPLTIADGHHRYETALRYRDTPGSAAGADYVMALLYDGHSGGLQLEPWQRVVAEAPDPATILAAAETAFVAQPVADAEEFIVALAAAPSTEERSAIGLWTPAGGSLLSFDRASLMPYLADISSEPVRRLDVSALSGTLRLMIGKSEPELTALDQLTYTHDAREAIRRVDEGDAAACFLLKATPVAAVLDVAAAGDFMPPKSTYFYPKAATGLVFDPLF